jgi:hypothetical protein
MANETYAIFLSYNSDDREAVEKLAVYLDDRAKLRPWFDCWSIIPGESWAQKLELGIKASGACAVIVGKSGVGSWQQPEVEAALRVQMRRPGFRVIPVLLPEAPHEPELPTFLEGNNWVDFRKGLDDDNALWRLECGIRGIQPWRGRPPLPVVQEPPPSLPTPAVVRDVEVAISPAKRTANIFVSYRHQEPDSVLAHTFAEALEKAGHEVFIDTGLRWGCNWVREIRESLERADYLLLLISEESGGSQMVVNEVHIARELARRPARRPIILPVRLQLPFTEPLPYQLAISLQNIHQESWAGPDDTSRLVERLLTTVAESSGWPREAGQAPASADGGVKQAQPLPQFDPRSMIIPGGAVETTSRFYIAREADEEVFFAVQRPRAVVTLRGPRQSGKTSLSMGIYASVRYAESPLRAAFVDFQSFKEKEFQTLDSIWHGIAARVAPQVRAQKPNEAEWSDYDNSCSTFLADTIFEADETPLLLCLDEVDAVFNHPIKNEFFSSIRYFFNRGARDACWKRVRWLLSTSSEPSFFIEDITVSPFNIGLRVEMVTFTPAEVGTFAGRHGLTLNDEEVARIIEYVGGRPFLVHLILYQMARRPSATEEIFDTRRASRGLFRDHLHSYLVQFQRDPALAAAMKQVIRGGSCEDAKLTDRLDAAGLVRRDEAAHVEPLCRLYAEFFGS